MFCESHTLRFVKIGHREGAFRSRRSNIRFFSNVGTSRFAQFAKCCWNPVLIHVCKHLVAAPSWPCMLARKYQPWSHLVSVCGRSSTAIIGLRLLESRFGCRMVVCTSYSAAKRPSWGTRGQCPYIQGMTGHCLATLIEATHHHHRNHSALLRHCLSTNSN